MTHDHSALLAQLDALTGADSAGVFADLIRAGLQVSIEAEATDKLGAGRYCAPTPAPPIATGIARRPWPRPAW
jgi:hypothetical protein